MKIYGLIAAGCAVRYLLHLVKRAAQVIFIGLFFVGSAFSANIVLAAADSTPTAFVENGTQKGILVDLINEAFRRAGYAVEIKLMPWARCIAEVRAGSVDGIFSIYKTLERQEFLVYADEVLMVQVQAFFVRKDSALSFNGDFYQLENASIGIINKTSYGPKLDEAIKSGVFKNIDLSNGVESNVKKLLFHHVDVIPSYRHVIISAAKQMNKSDVIVELSPPIDSIPSYLAFSRGGSYTNIIHKFNKALGSMKSDGTYDKIFKDYLQ